MSGDAKHKFTYTRSDGSAWTLALKDVLDAFAHGDVAKAHDVWQRDEEIDHVYTGLFRELLTYMMEDTRYISRALKLIFIANPDNPTGTVYSRECLDRMVRLAKEYNLFLVADEIYTHITYNGAKAIAHQREMQTRVARNGMQNYIYGPLQ